MKSILDKHAHMLLSIYSEFIAWIEVPLSLSAQTENVHSTRNIYTLSHVTDGLVINIIIFITLIKEGVTFSGRWIPSKMFSIIPGPSSTDSGLPVLSTGSPIVTPAVIMCQGLQRCCSGRGNITVPQYPLSMYM